MKVAITSIVFSCIVIIGFLATVDLEPYLGHKSAQKTGEITATLEPGKKELILKQLAEQEATEFSDSPQQKQQAAAEIESPRKEALDTAPPPTPAPETETNQAIIQNQQASQAVPQEAATAPREELALDEPQQTSGSTAQDLSAPMQPPVSTLKIYELPAGEYPYAILLNSFDSKVKAEAEGNRLAKSGIENYYVQVQLGKKGIWYRLFTGFFPTIEAANTFAQEHKLLDKPVKQTMYAAKISSSKDPKGLITPYNKALQTNTSPYVLHSQDSGDYSLWLGAFYTRAGAELQCKALIKIGLSCSAEKRAIMK